MPRFAILRWIRRRELHCISQNRIGDAIRKLKFCSVSESSDVVDMRKCCGWSTNPRVGVDGKEAFCLLRNPPRPRYARPPLPGGRIAGLKWRAWVMNPQIPSREGKIAAGEQGWVPRTTNPASSGSQQINNDNDLGLAANAERRGMHADAGSGEQVRGDLAKVDRAMICRGA